MVRGHAPIRCFEAYLTPFTVGDLRDPMRQRLLVKSFIVQEIICSNLQAYHNLRNKLMRCRVGRR